MKSSRGLALIAAIPVLAACGNGSTTAQIPVSSSYSVAPQSSSHAPTSSKPAGINSSKPAVATPAPAVTPHTNAAPAVTPAPVHNTPVQNAPAPASHTPAANRSGAKSATRAVAAPTQSGTTPSAHSNSSAIAPTRGKAPVVVAPNSGAKGPSATKSASFTAALVTQVAKGQPSPTKQLGNGTWTVYVTGINATSVTVSVLGKATEPCSDDCLNPISTETIPLASTNISTILPVKNASSVGGGFPGVTAPAWAYAEIFNQGQTGLNKAVADPRYAISPALKARIDPGFALTSSGAKSVYSDITIKNGVVTDLEWTFHP